MVPSSDRVVVARASRKRGAAWRWFAAAVSALALAGCGGGGGGGGDSGGSAPPPVGSTSLIPAAPTPGAVLQADASTLRPLTVGGLWRYQGQITEAGTATVTYTTDTSIASASAGALTESGTNSANEGAASHPIALEAGSIVVTEQFDFTGKGPGETVKMTQLRSPVRVDDQWTVLERRFTDTDIDVDGDNKPDAIDVAIYARVIGEDTIALPLMAPLKAVRVDTRVLTRLIPSSTGKAGDVVTLEIQDWYAPGIGLVMERTRAPGTTATQIRETLESLIGYDIGTDGGGLGQSQTAQVPATAQALAGSVLPEGGTIVTAGEVGNEVLLVQRVNGASPPDLLISRFDRRGQVLDTVRQSGTVITTDVPPMVHPNGVLIVDQKTATTDEVRLVSLDARAAPTGTPPIVNLRTSSLRPELPALAGVLGATTDGRTVWLMWQRGNLITTVRELVVRGFAFDGTPTTGELVLDSVETRQQRIARSGGRLVATWLRADAGGTFDQIVQAIDPVTLTGSAPSTIATTLPGFPLDASVQGFFNQTTGSTLAWLRGSGQGGALTGIAMLRLDADTFLPRRGTSGSIDTEVVPGLPPAGSMKQLAGRGQRIYHLQMINAAADGAANPVYLFKLSWLDAQSTPLSQATPRFTSVLPSRSDLPAFFVPLSDRVLGFGGGSELRTTVIWLPKDAR